jgi:hypothetical protein
VIVSSQTLDVCEPLPDVREAAAKLPNLSTEVEPTVDETLLKEIELASEED